MTRTKLICLLLLMLLSASGYARVVVGFGESRGRSAAATTRAAVQEMVEQILRNPLETRGWARLDYCPQAHHYSMYTPLHSPKVAKVTVAALVSQDRAVTAAPLAEKVFDCYGASLSRRSVSLRNLSGTPLDLRLSTVTGQEIEVLQLSGGATGTLDLSNLPSGVYVLRAGVQTERLVLHSEML